MSVFVKADGFEMNKNKVHKFLNIHPNKKFSAAKLE